MTYTKEERAEDMEQEAIEDLDIKIGTPEQAFWKEIADKTKSEIESLEKMLKFNKAILQMANERRLEENGV